MKNLITKNLILLCLCLTSFVRAMTRDEDRAIRSAAIYQNWPLHEELVTARINVNEKALLQAAQQANGARVQELIAARTDVNVADLLGNTPLHRAVAREDTNVKGILLPSKPADLPDKTPLHPASTFGSAEIIRMLLAAEAHVNRANNHGYTPLHCAVLNCTVALSLVTAPCTVPLIHQKQKMKILVATLRNLTEIIRILIDAGADVNLVEKLRDTGDTPLHTAVKGRDTERARILLAAGANPDLRNNRGVTPYDLARQQGATAIISLIDDYHYLRNSTNRTVCKSVLAVHHARCGVNSRMSELPQSVVQEIVMHLKPGRRCVYTQEELDQITKTEKELLAKTSS